MQYIGLFNFITDCLLLTESPDVMKELTGTDILKLELIDYIKIFYRYAIKVENRLI